MADLKYNNSNYDTSIDTYTPLANTDTIEVTHVNGALSAIIAMEGKLGVGLPGSQATLAARLTQMLASNGAIKGGTSFPTSPTPVDAQLFWRTDLKVLYIYDGALGQWQGLQIPATFNFSSPSAFTLALYHNITAARTITFPDATDQLIARNTTDTLTNKTLTSPVINTPIIATIINTGTLTLPTITDTLVGRATTDTLTNKTLTSPVINTPTGIVKGDVGLGNVDNTSNATERAATATLTNKTITAPAISSPAVTGDMTYASTTVVTNLNAEQHNGLKVKVIDIGDWDMDTNGNKTIAHGLTLSTIRAIKVTIRNDADTIYSDLSSYDVSAAPSIYVEATTVTLGRLTSGWYDSTSHNATSFNRGWITIWYVP